MVTTTKVAKPAKPAKPAKSAKSIDKPATPAKSVVKEKAKPSTAATRKPVARKAAPKPAAKKAAMSGASALASEQRRFYVEVAAYYIAERRGFRGGSELGDWVQAEAEIDRLLREGILKP